jgi:hypothetical protein
MMAKQEKAKPQQSASGFQENPPGQPKALRQASRQGKKIVTYSSP